MHGGVHLREVGAPYWPRVARDGVRKKQLLDHDIRSRLFTEYIPYMILRTGVHI